MNLNMLSGFYRWLYHQYDMHTWGLRTLHTPTFVPFSHPWIIRVDLKVHFIGCLGFAHQKNIPWVKHYKFLCFNRFAKLLHINFPNYLRSIDSYYRLDKLILLWYSNRELYQKREEECLNSFGWHSHANNQLHCSLEWVTDLSTDLSDNWNGLDGV